MSRFGPLQHSTQLPVPNALSSPIPPRQEEAPSNCNKPPIGSTKSTEAIPIESPIPLDPRSSSSQSMTADYSCSEFACLLNSIKPVIKVKKPRVSTTSLNDLNIQTKVSGIETVESNFNKRSKTITLGQSPSIGL